MKDNFDLKNLKPKKKINSKRKGNKFENDVSKILNERFETKDFCRTPGSGAFATTHKLPDHLIIHGDLITPKDFKYIIECKSGYDSEDLGSFFKPKSQIYKFIKQAETDAQKANKDFLVLYKQTRRDILAISSMDNDLLNHLINLDTFFITINNKYICCLFKDFITLDTSLFYNYF